MQTSKLTTFGVCELGPYRV